MPIFVILSPWGGTISSHFLIKKRNSSVVWWCHQRCKACHIPKLLSTKHSYLSLHTAIHSSTTQQIKSNSAIPNTVPPAIPLGLRQNLINHNQNLINYQKQERANSTHRCIKAHIREVNPNINNKGITKHYKQQYYIYIHPLGKLSNKKLKYYSIKIMNKSS